MTGELTKVTDAIKAKDSSVTVTNVQKASAGSYDAFGTKFGSQVKYEVSADLKTVTQAGGGGHHDGSPDSTSGSTTN